MIISSFESKKILKNFAPDICIGTGGYVMGAFLYQAYTMKIPFVIQEQNAIPGLTTKFLSKYAKMVFLGNKMASKYLRIKKFMLTGNPINNNFEKINREDARRKLGITNDLPVILSFGGSLGSKTINNVMLDIIKMKKYNHIHGYGKKNIDFRQKIEPLNHRNIKEYLENMDECMVACDLIISRSGAMTLSELAVLGKPAILIPSPNVTDNHQFFNAISYAKKFPASVIKEEELTAEKLETEITRLLSYKKNIKPEKNIACEQIYNFLDSFVNNTSQRFN